MADSKALKGFDDYREMLGDTVRMNAWKAAIEQVVQPGDVVLDLGAGTGILGFWALQAGAAHVHMIEQGNAIELARAVAAHNGWTEQITFHQANSLDVQLPVPADVLVSETLGSIAIDENTLPYTLDARRRLLAPGGRMIPERLDVWLAPIERAPEHVAKAEFWKDVGGIDYTAAAKAEAGRMGLVTLQPEQLLARPERVATIDLRQYTDAALALTQRFVFRKTGEVHGLAGWFSARLCEGVEVRTGPDDPPTHWQQAFLPFRESVQVGLADILDLELHLAGLGEREDQTRVSWDYFCSQIDLEDGARARLPCPCGSQRKVKRCHGRPP